MEVIDINLSVPSYKKSDFTSFIKKLDKLSKKIGIEPLSVSVLRNGSFNRIISEFYTSVIEFEVINVKGSLPTVAGDWDILGMVDFVSEETPIVTQFTSHELDKKYRSAKPTCEHCNHERKRNSVYILSNGSDELQVGATCLDKFTGDKMARMLSEFSGLFSSTIMSFDVDESSADFGTYSKDELRLDSFLALCLVDANQRNFIPKSQESYELPSTATFVTMLLESNDKEIRKILNSYIKMIDEEVKNTVSLLIEKHISNFNPETQSNYNYRLSQIAKYGFVNSKSYGFAASIIGGFLREEAEKRQNTDIKNEGRPEPVKTRVKGVVLKFIKSVTKDSAYGEMFITTFKDEDNRMIVTKSANFFNKDMLADFTIKSDPKEYKGIIQTEVARLKCVRQLT